MVSLAGPRGYHTKWRKSDIKTNIIWDHLCVGSKKYTNGLIYQTNKLTDTESKFMVAKGERRNG